MSFHLRYSKYVSKIFQIFPIYKVDQVSYYHIMINIPNEVAQVYVNGVVFQGTSETRKKKKNALFPSKIGFYPPVN